MRIYFAQAETDLGHPGRHRGAAAADRGAASAARSLERPGFRPAAGSGAAGLGDSRRDRVPGHRTDGKPLGGGWRSASPPARPTSRRRVVATVEGFGGDRRQAGPDRSRRRSRRTNRSPRTPNRADSVSDPPDPPRVPARPRPIRSPDGRGDRHRPTGPAAAGRRRRGVPLPVRKARGRGHAAATGGRDAVPDHLLSDLPDRRGTLLPAGGERSDDRHDATRCETTPPWPTATARRTEPTWRPGTAGRGPRDRRGQCRRDAGPGEVPARPGRARTGRRSRGESPGR